MHTRALGLLRSIHEYLLVTLFNDDDNNYKGRVLGTRICKHGEDLLDNPPIRIYMLDIYNIKYTAYRRIYQRISACAIPDDSKYLSIPNGSPRSLYTVYLHLNKLVYNQSSISTRD